jgi:hypothetical protein
LCFFYDQIGAKAKNAQKGRWGEHLTRKKVRNTKDNRYTTGKGQNAKERDCPDSDNCRWFLTWGLLTSIKKKNAQIDIATDIKMEAK